MVYSISSKLNPDDYIMSLNNAPKHIQLAVDLIELLEENQIDDQTVVAALEIVLKDYKTKLDKASANQLNKDEDK